MRCFDSKDNCGNCGSGSLRGFALPKRRRVPYGDCRPSLRVAIVFRPYIRQEIGIEALL